MNEDTSMDGTHPDTTHPLGESIDPMGNLLDPEQVDDDQLDIDVARNNHPIEDDNNELDMDISDHIDQPEDNNNYSSNEYDMDIADHIDQFEDDNDDFSVDAIALDGTTPAVTNLLIHGIIDQAGDMPMPPVFENYETATDEFVMVYTVNGQREPIEPYIHYRY